MQARHRVASFVLLCALHGVATAQAQPDNETFKTLAAKESAHLHQTLEYQHAGCGVNALLDHRILRSREPLLQAGDRIVSVNGQAVQDNSDSAFRLVNSLSTGDAAHLRIVRNGAPRTVQIPCKNAAVLIGYRVAALDEAASGRFAQCADSVAEYEKQYVKSSVMYGLWRACSIRAGNVIGDASWTTLVTYWTLRLQELKYEPDSIDETRSPFLSALTSVLNAQQPLLAGEMRRQWALATGESFAPAPNPSSQALTAPTVAAPVSHRRRSYSSCEDGHWIEEVLSDGAVVKLEDGSLWRVDDADTVDSALWLPTTDIVICDGKLINTEDNESVSARPIR